MEYKLTTSISDQLYNLWEDYPIMLALLQYAEYIYWYDMERAIDFTGGNGSWDQLAIDPISIRRFSDGRT